MVSSSVPLVHIMMCIILPLKGLMVTSSILKSKIHKTQPIMVQDNTKPREFWHVTHNLKYYDPKVSQNQTINHFDMLQYQNSKKLCLHVTFV